jgi:tRNA (Thr-GGU) A37 N-methylase
MLIPYGQPVLDIKPYLPYSDSVKGAAVPGWLEVCTMLHIKSCIIFYQLKYGMEVLSGSPSL